MNARVAATIGAVLGGLAVVLGAFGAHVLRARLSPGDLETYETAVRYQMYHALALFAAAWLIAHGAPGACAAAWSFIGGVVVFSGSLYLLVATGARWWGAVTPVGGLGMIAGWVLLAIAAAKSS